MRREALVQFMERNAVASLVFDPNGALMEAPVWRGANAPLKLIAFIEEDFEGRRKVVAELGVGRTHPYCSNHAVAPYPERRTSLRALTERQLARFLPGLIRVLNLIVEERSRRWSLVRERNGILYPVERHDRFLLGVAFSAHQDDEALVRFFEEWMVLNTLDLDYKVERMAWVLNRTRKSRRKPRRLGGNCRYQHRWVRHYGTGNRRGGYPEGYYEFQRLLGHPLSTPPFFLRPLLLAELGRKLENPISFFQFLLDRRLAGDAAVREALGLMREQKTKPRLLAGFAGLRSDEIHARKDTLAIVPLGRLAPHWMFRATLKSSEWATRQAREEARYDADRRANASLSRFSSLPVEGDDAVPYTEWGTDSGLESVDEPGMHG